MAGLGVKRISGKKGSCLVYGKAADFVPELGQILLDLVKRSESPHIGIAEKYKCWLCVLRKKPQGFRYHSECTAQSVWGTCRSLVLNQKVCSNGIFGFVEDIY